MPRADLSPSQRSALSVAFAIDTLSALSRSRNVHDIVVVSPNPEIAWLADGAGAEFVLSESGTELNDAIKMAHECTRQPTDQVVAAIASDLPALLTNEIDEVLALAARCRDATYVSDLCGTGVTFQAERAGTFAACLAPDPTTRHRPRGTNATALLPGMRCDVDTSDGLRIADFIGVGPATTTVISEVLGVVRRRSERA